MARLERMSGIETPESAPQYELRVRRHKPADAEYEIWQTAGARLAACEECDTRPPVCVGEISNWWNIGF